MAVRFSFKTTFIVLITVALCVLGVINSAQKTKYVTPDDGCGWVVTARGIEAYIVEKGGAAERAGIHQADVLLAINGIRVTRASDVTDALYASGIWSKIKYRIARGSAEFDVSLVVVPQETKWRIKRFLEVVGFSYLFIGVFIFLRRWQAAGALHFYSICLASYVLYAYSFTGKLNPFDWTVYWLDALAFLILPPLFFHFCLAFPESRRSALTRSLIKVLFYAPAAVLLLVQVLFVYEGLSFLRAPLKVRNFLDKLHTLHFGVFFLLGVVALLVTYFRSRNQTLRQQMKWIVLGTTAGTLPFLAFYVLPYWMGVVPTVWMDASVFPLVLIPLAFGYAIIKYRLMDVDIIFKRGLAATLASLAVVGFYFGLIALVSEVFRASGAHRIWSIIAIVVAGFIFAPLRNWIQNKVDKYFYRDRYDYRQTLIEFGKTLGSEINLNRLLNSVIERISRTLSVDKIAIFLRSDSKERGFELARSMGIQLPASGVPTHFLDPSRTAMAKGYLFYENLRDLPAEPLEFHEPLRLFDLHYYLPCITKGETIAFIGLGRTTRGDLLTSEDVELLQTIAGYVAIAIENSRLYESIHEKAEQLQRLKEYSENIVESISVGVLVLGFDKRIESWNTQMEGFTGIRRSSALGKRLTDIFPENLVSAIHARLGEQHLHYSEVAKLYKFNLRTAAGPRVADITVTPLLGRDGQITGQILIFDDKTEWAKLEDQLIQSEKMTSIGLLAAGVAHEVNTPLAVISSYSQMLYKHLKQEEPKAKILDKIIKQSFRASEIVNSLLNFSRTSGSEFRMIDMHSIINDTLSLLEHQFKTGKIAVKRELGANSLPVYGNPGKLQQVFLNLFINAKDAMPEGGELTVKTTSYDSAFRIEVVDTGTGIAGEHLKKIYDPFFTTKEIGRGTGLGLSVSYGIIQEHSGKILVDSAVGKGTRFVIEFPAARKVANV
ncbi:MAG: ATP-binding protein [Acidobacteriota bacterium]